MAAAISLLAACSSAPADDSATTVKTGGALTTAFSTSANRANVPRDLLVAIARVEDGLSIPARRDNLDVDNEVPVAGPLQLRRGRLDTLARAAALSGKTELDLRVDADLALSAGALVLADLGRQTGATPDDLATWEKAIEEMSGFADDPHRQSYAHQVFATLAGGGTFTGRDGESIVLPRHDLPPALTLEIDTKLHTLATAQYAGAEWFPTSCSNKCTIGRGGNTVKYVVIHDTEGGWNASVATLQNDPGKSVQYIVDRTGKIGQFITEENTAWHAGNFWYNERSIGIEHVGYANQPYPEEEYAASAKLVDHLATKYNVTRDRAHIIGHDQIPNGNAIGESSAACASSPKSCEGSSNYGGADNHHDPGVWEWAEYMDRFAGEAKCNDVTNLWNCDNDLKHAARCNAGKVEVTLCDGPGACQVQANGVDDVCNVAPKSAAPAPATDPASSNEPSPAGDAPKPLGTHSAPLDAPPSADSGCAFAPRRTAFSGSTALLALAALGAVFVRRRRSQA